MHRLITLGAVALVHEQGPAGVAGRSTQRRRLALLSLLAVGRGLGVSRDRLLAILWPEHDASRARHALSQALYALRRQLGRDALLSGVDDVRLNPARVYSDVTEFEAAIEARDLQRAVDLYRGPFLDGFHLDGAPEFDRWSEAERRRLAGLCGAALEALAAGAGRANDHRAAAEWWRRRAAQDAHDSSIALRLMQALADAGDRAGAVRHGREHIALLREQLEVEPDPAVVALIEHLRQPPSAHEAIAVAAPVAPPPASRPAEEQAPQASSPRAAPRASTPARHAPAPMPVAREPRGGPGPAHVTIVRRRLGFRAALAVLAALGLSATTVLLGAGWLRWDAPSPEPLPVVLGSIHGPRPVLGLAVREALRAEFDDARDLAVLPEARASELLRLMGRPSDEPIDDAAAAELAARAGIPIVVTGSVVPIGAGAQIVARVVDARTGATLESLTERPATPDEIVAAVARLAAALRMRVLDSPVAVREAPLPAVSTASLPALQHYALARQALARHDRDAAIHLLRGALAHDSAFALAHYVLADLYWYVDHQAESERHLARAVALGATLPARERLIVEARHEQLGLDRPELAVDRWTAVRTAYPDEPLAYEGLTWAYMALGRYTDAARAAAEALRLDPAGAGPHVRNRFTALVAAGDTAAAHAFAMRRSDRTPLLAQEARITGAMLRRDWRDGLSVIDSVRRGDAAAPTEAWSWQRHALLLALGRLEEADAELQRIVQANWRQAPARARLLQARIELARGGSVERAAAHARAVAAWLKDADLSPPAVARLAERAADVAARSGDTATVRALRGLVERRDAGRGLRTYRLALLAIDAAAAYARGRPRLAAELAAEARRGTFFGRSAAAIALLEADARARAGQAAGAAALYRQIADRTIVDADIETWAALQPLAAQP